MPYTKRIVDLELAHETDLYFVAGLERGTGKCTLYILVYVTHADVAMFLFTFVMSIVQSNLLMWSPLLRGHLS